MLYLCTGKLRSNMMKRLFFDMDGVLADFESGIKKLDEDTLKEYKDRYEEVPGFFSTLEPIDGAVKAAKSLSKHYDVFILSTAPWKNPSAWSDKPKSVVRLNFSHF